MDLRFLASDSLQGRLVLSSGSQRAQQYITQHLTLAKLVPLYTAYQVPFDLSSDPEKGKGVNLIAKLEGEDTTLANALLISAHYDHIGMQSSGGEGADTIFNGANDNAVGSALVLDLMKRFAKGPKPKRTVLFAWFDAEESGLLGSIALAQRFKEEGKRLHAVINLEMLGVPMTDFPGQAYVSGYEKSTLPQVLNHYVDQPILIQFKEESRYGVFSRSDNYPFYKLLAIPAHTICSFDFKNYNYYHKVGDEVDQVNLAFVRTMADNLFAMLSGYANDLDHSVVLN